MNKRAANLDGRTGGVELVCAGRPTLRRFLTEEIYMTDLQRCFAQGAKMKVETKPKVDHTPAEFSEEADLLLKAAAILDRDGHAKNILWRESPTMGPTCLMGALNRAYHGVSFHPDNERDFNKISAIAGKVHGGTSAKAVAWNNEVERTKDEVVAKLRAVALGL